MIKGERIWSIAMTVLAAVLVAAILGTPSYTKDFIARSISMPPVVEELEEYLSPRYVSAEYLQQQNYDTQMYRYNQSIQRLERDMISPATTMEQKHLYQNQKSQLERQKADEQKTWENRSK